MSNASSPLAPIIVALTTLHLFRIQPINYPATSAVPTHSIVVDDTNKLQAAIDEVPEGGMLKLDSRTYVCQDIKVTRSIIIQGAGADKTILRRTAAKPVFRLSGDRVKVRLEGFTIDGDFLPASGIVATTLAELDLRRIRVRNCGRPIGHAIAKDSLGQSVDGVYAYNVNKALVDQCEFSENHRDGFIGIPVKHLFFTNNRCLNNGRMGCTSDRDREPNGPGGPLSVVYENNWVSNCGTGGLHVESTFGNPEVTARFENNTILNCGDQDWGYSWGIVLGPNCSGIVRGNTVDGVGQSSNLKTYRSGILIGGAGGPVTVYNNTVLHAGLSGIVVNDCKRPVQITGNRIRFSGENGVTIYQSEAVSVSNCIISRSQKQGIWLRLAPNCQIIGNTITNNSQISRGKHPGIRAELSRALVITNNTFELNDQNYGLELDNSNYISSLRFFGNTVDGSESHASLCNFKLTTTKP